MRIHIFAFLLLAVFLSNSILAQAQHRDPKLLKKLFGEPIKFSIVMCSAAISTYMKNKEFLEGVNRKIEMSPFDSIKDDKAQVLV